MSLKINPQDVVKLMLQYCQENGLEKTFATLQGESGVALNSVADFTAISGQIQNGQ